MQYYMLRCFDLPILTVLFSPGITFSPLSHPNGTPSMKQTYKQSMRGSIVGLIILRGGILIQKGYSDN